MASIPTNDIEAAKMDEDPIVICRLVREQPRFAPGDVVVLKDAFLQKRDVFHNLIMIRTSANY